MNQDELRPERMEDFESLMNETLQQPSRGEIVKSVVVKISTDSVIVNFGYKTEGIVDRSELKEDIKIGDEVELTVVSFIGGSYVQLSNKAFGSDAAWDELKLQGDNAIVSVKVTGKVDKGYIGKVGEIDAFIPENHIDTAKDVDPKTFIGKTLKSVILKFGEGRRKSVLVSPRIYLKGEADRQRESFFLTLKIGDKIKGTVKTLKEYGAFINLGAMDGFLHKNDIVWQRISDIEKYLSVGDIVETVITDLKEDQMKVTLGIKQLSDNPWDSVESTAPINASISGTLITKKRNGYIVELDNGVDGIISYDEISWLKNARQSLTIKDRVECKVLGFDNDNKKIILSLRAMFENPWKSIKTEQPEGSIVKGKIKSITDFGIFLDFGSVIDGLIRKGDISWSVEDINLKEIYKIGDEIEAKILTIDDEKERISLSIKHLEDNPWADVNKLLPVGKVIDSIITSVTKLGLETELPMKLKGWIAIQDLDPTKPALDRYEVGTTIAAQVIRADIRDKKVILSIKKYLNDTERKDTKEYMKQLANTDQNFSFGSILKDKFEQE